MRKLNDSSQPAAGDHEHDMDSIGDLKPTDILVEATATGQSTAGGEGGDQPSLTEDATDHHNIVSDMLLSERVSFYPNTLQHPATGGAKELSPPRGVTSAAVTLRGAGYKVPQSCDIKPGPNSKGQLVASNKGGAKLLYEGYNYTMKKSVNHHVYWICAHRKKIGCTGSLRTTRALEAHKVGLNSFSSEPRKSLLDGC